MKEWGFHRNAGRFETKLTDQTVGVLCMGVSAVNPIDVSFVVGVRFVEVENLAARLQGIPAHVPAWTVGIPLSDLSHADGVRSTIRMYGTDEDRATIDHVLEAVSAVGIPFMRQWSDFGRLIQHMEDLLGQQIPLAPRVTDPATTLPVALALTGNWQKGRAIVQETVASLPLLKNRGYAFTYAKFAEAYEKLAADRTRAAQAK